MNKVGQYPQQPIMVRPVDSHLSRNGLSRMIPCAVSRLENHPSRYGCNARPAHHGAVVGPAVIGRAAMTQKEDA